MKPYAIIVAGGNGSRMQSATPKQFLLVAGRPLLLHTLEVFTNALEEVNLVLVLPADYIAYTQTLLKEYNFNYPVELVAGGETRFHSVQNGLKVVKEECVVFVHDAVRCLITPDLIRRCYQQTIEKGTAIPVIPVKDSVRSVADTGHHKVVDRSVLRLVQTPQTFKTEILLPAFECEYATAFTDEASVVEAAGGKVELVEGEESNIKITTPSDLLIAEAYFANE
ncbi:MAG: 2-C-methyl-D-erythritol 4-phosphate cytidylyltransferase [Bacteroidetes bacterium]|nr:2-C-methyl-D-erythritol 4-phosphate cytidylyltransferase [Bacteroidota bacterium]